MIETAYYTDLHLRQSTGPLLDKIRRLALRRGMSGLKDLGYHFSVKRGATAAGAKEVKLNQDDFKEKLKNFGVLLSLTEHNLLCLAFKDAVGYVCVSTFVETVSGVLTAARQDVVDRAFAKVDKDGSGVLEINDIREVYDAKNHPKVKSGAMTEDMVLAEFLDVFESEDSRDGKVTKEEWNAYYGAMSISIADDAYFNEVVINAWHLDEPSQQKKGRQFLVPDQQQGGGAASGSAGQGGVGAAGNATMTGTMGRTMGGTLKFGGALGESAEGKAYLHHSGDAPTVQPKRIAGYTGHLPHAQERHGQTFSQVEASVPRSQPKKNAWLEGTYQDDKNAFVRKGGKANAHNFRMA